MSKDTKNLVKCIIIFGGYFSGTACISWVIGKLVSTGWGKLWAWILKKADIVVNNED